MELQHQIVSWTAVAMFVFFSIAVMVGFAALGGEALIESFRAMGKAIHAWGKK